MLNAFGSNLLWKRRLSAFFCNQNFWSRTFLREIMAENVPKNDQNQVFWWDTYSKLGHEWPKIRQTVDLGHLKPILYQPRGGFTPNWGPMSEFSQKKSLGVPTWTHKRPVGLYQANLCSVVRAHGTLLGPPGVLVPSPKPFCEISEKSVSRARARGASQISQRDKNWSQVRFYSCVSINTTGITQHKPPNNLFNHQNWPKTLKFSDFWGAAAKFEGGHL